MVDLRPTSGGQGGFQVGGKGQRPPALRPRERLRVLLLLAVTAAIIAVMVLRFSGGAETGDGDAARPEQPELGLKALPDMALPDLAALPPLPDYDAIKALSADVDTLLRDSASLRLHLDGLDDRTIAWARAQLLLDRDAPPLPQGFAPEDYIRAHIPPGAIPRGTAVVVTGLIVDQVETVLRDEGGEDERWMYYSLLLDNPEKKSLILVLLAPIWAVPEHEQGVMGERVHVVGRFLGPERMPSQAAPEQDVPVVAAYGISRENDVEITQLLGLDRPEHEGPAVPVAEDVFEGIDDIPPALEIRPYYHLLGQARLDASTPGVYDEAGPAERVRGRIWEEPSRFRGTPLQVSGKVWDAWEDVQVARDKPYDIRRVFRIRIWKTVFGLGEAPFHDLYEIAAIVDDDRPLPRPGDRIEATGRFLKVHAYRSDKSPAMDAMNNVRRYSDNVYFIMIVAPGFEVLPPPELPDLLWSNVLFAIVALSFMVWMGVLIRRERLQGDDYKRPMKRLRAARRKLQRQEKEGAAEAPSGERPADTPDEPRPEEGRRDDAPPS